MKDSNVTGIELNEIAHLVRYYDTQGKDQILTPDEWNSVVLPCEDNDLRERVLARPAKEWKDVGRIPSDIEGQVCDIIIKEIHLIRKLEALKKSLFAEVEEKKVFSTTDLFKSIDANNNGVFNLEELGAFLKEAGYDATEFECAAIIRRIDTDGSMDITLQEFNDFMMVKNPAPQDVDVSGYNPTTYVPLADPLYKRSWLGYPYRSSYLYYSP